MVNATGKFLLRLRKERECAIVDVQHGEINYEAVSTRFLYAKFGERQAIKQSRKEISQEGWVDLMGITLPGSASDSLNEEQANGSWLIG